MSSEKIATDICIVGGGPAGLVLALLLLKSGVRVAVVEKHGGAQREFRGEILQPGAMKLLDRLGVLGGARARGAHEHERFRLVDRDRVLLDIDYRTLPAPYDHLLSIPQDHLLSELLLHCRHFADFAYLDRRRLSALPREGGRVAGVRADGAGGPVEVRALAVVGADGRFSKTRQLAGIGAGRVEAFDLDVLWFKLRRSEAEPGRTRDVRVFRAGGSPVLAYDSFPDRIQVGWTLPHKGYQAVLGRGFGHVKNELARAVPEYADLVHEQLSSVRDVSLLDVFSGRADRWAVDGLLLIGDAAHTHSPIGAQGINLAVQDAVVAHPVLVDAVRRGDAGAAALGVFEQRRAPDIARVARLQSVQSKAMLSHGTFATRVRPKLAAAVRHTPLYRKILNAVAYGNQDIRIAEELLD
ncbi:FAD-dependent monooxygenase [Streptomyces sp. NPDC003032]